jgi:hypothetical protein
MAEQFTADPHNELVAQRDVLAGELEEWRDAGAPSEALVDAVEALIDAKIAQRQMLPLEPLSSDYIQTVPDKCDRIIWCGRYYDLHSMKPEERK